MCASEMECPLNVEALVSLYGETMPPVALEVLDREWLTVRARLLEVAAALDRIHRARGSVTEDPRMEQIQKSLALLANERDDRAAQLQMAFSLPYDPEWRERYGV